MQPHPAGAGQVSAQPFDDHHRPIPSARHTHGLEAAGGVERLEVVHRRSCSPAEAARRSPGYQLPIGRRKRARWFDPPSCSSRKAGHSAVGRGLSAKSGVARRGLHFAPLRAFVGRGRDACCWRGTGRVCAGAARWARRESPDVAGRVGRSSSAHGSRSRSARVHHPMDGVTTRVVEDRLYQGPLEKLELVAILD